MLCLREPSWIRPAIVTPHTPFRVVVERGPECGPIALLLRAPEGVADLCVTSRRTAGEGRFLVLECAVDPSAPEGMYALEASAPGARLRMPRAVLVRKQFRQSFTFIHTSDLHLLKVCNGALCHRVEMAEGLVEAINAASPEFVIHTGDVISRYGSGPTDILPEAWVRWQFETFARIAQGLRVPMFLIPGNHDRAFAWCRREWRTHMGEPWDGPCHDYAFDYGDCRFFGLDGSAEYDEQTGRSRGATYSTQRLALLAHDLASAASKQRRFLFCHYDYTGQLAPMLTQAEVDMILYGHAKAVRWTAESGNGPAVSHLQAAEAYREVRVAPEELTLGKPRLYADLGREQPCSEPPAASEAGCRIPRRAQE